ncbi:MAG TPA: carbon monoxide dehydrogenase subunit G [Thermoanaerobaculia bacterium]|nr:carbon monoxide dehydrogenase subunit G [Thermoanaerobaculia bacterium]
MKLQGTYTFDAPRERVWRALLDPAILARTLPGCEKLERVGENNYLGVLNVQVGPVKGQFQGTLVLTDVRPLEGYHMKLDGKGPAGFMNGEGDLRLTDTGSSTLLTYDIDSQVGGRVAAVGQRLLESSSKSVARQGLEGLAREISAMGESEAAAAPIPPPTQLSQTELAARVAGDVARDMARDLVPPERRPWLIGGALLAATVVILLLVRACGA